MATMAVLVILVMSSITITTGSTTCKDNKSSCKEWADKGYCQSSRYKEYMERECRVTCGVCSPVNGNWGEWSEYGACSNPCGGGHKKKSRSCDNPAPADGGQDCPGKGEMTKDCNTQPCSVNGNWGCWSEYSKCSKSCGRGHQSRSRSCDNPAPAHGGQDCPGKREMTTDCNTWPCQDINECTAMPAPCNRHGQCRNTDGSYTCDCQCGYTGDRCETELFDGAYTYQYRGMCYAYVNESKNFSDAQSHCTSIDGYLAEVLNEAQNAFLKTTIWADVSHNNSIWLGADNIGMGTLITGWKWSHSHIYVPQRGETGKGFEDWLKPDPNNAGGIEHCMSTSNGTNWGWWDWECALLKPFICQQPH